MLHAQPVLMVQILKVDMTRHQLARTIWLMRTSKSTHLFLFIIVIVDGRPILSTHIIP